MPRIGTPALRRGDLEQLAEIDGRRPPRRPAPRPASLRRTSVHGQYAGAPSPSQQPPRSTPQARAALAIAATSCASRVLPMPGAPLTISRRPRPDRDRIQAAADAPRAPADGRRTASSAPSLSADTCFACAVRSRHALASPFVRSRVRSDSSTLFLAADSIRSPMPWTPARCSQTIPGCSGLATVLVMSDLPMRRNIVTPDVTHPG